MTSLPIARRKDVPTLDLSRERGSRFSGDHNRDRADLDSFEKSGQNRTDEAETSLCRVDPKAQAGSEQVEDEPRRGNSVLRYSVADSSPRLFQFRYSGHSNARRS